jgi:hypothetical protein
MRFLTTLGIILMLAGIIGAGVTYRDMATENLLHAKTGIVTLKLSDTSDWKTEKFSLYQSGNHLLVLTTVNNFSMPYIADTLPEPSGRFHGKIEVRISQPSGAMLLNKVYSGNTLSLNVPYNMSWSVLDTLHIGEPFEGTWSIKARVGSADTAFSRTTSEVFIFPPQKYDIGWYLYDKTFQLMGFALLILIGFILLFVSGFLKKRVKENILAN